jgi:antitoxin HicB
MSYSAERMNGMREKELKRYASLPYKFVCQYDPDDKVYVVRYPELRGCVAHGKTVEDALSRAEKFKREWLQTALEAGDQIPEPQPEPEYSGKLLVRLPIGMHGEVARVAGDEDVSINAFIVQAVGEKLQRTGLRHLLNDALAGLFFPTQGNKGELIESGKTVNAISHSVANND